jgi:UDP-2,4-diacetamido-2,4,6-trideoxy-beta-L-altropyranose hydrolase
MRCLALAATFMDGGWRVAFAASKATFSSVAALESATVDRLVVSGDAGAEPNELLAWWPGGVELLVVDHYHRDAEFERACRGWARRILVIDDLANRPHDADILADTAAESEAAYRGLVSSSCKILPGPKFAVVHPAFRQARCKALARRDGRPAGRVLMSFGQVDSPNATMRALDALQAVGFAGKVDVVLGRAAPHLEEVQAKATDRVLVHVDVGDMPELMTAADLAIGAGGGTAWERCCLGLPSILVAVAENQRGIIARVSSANAGIDAGAVGSKTKDRIAEAFLVLVDNAARRTAMARSASALVDGRGCDRVFAAAIGTDVSSDHKRIGIRPAETADKNWVFGLQSRPETRRFFRNPSIPLREEHDRWFDELLRDPERMLLVIERDGDPVGTVRSDRLSPLGGNSRYEVSIVVDPSFHGLGIGNTALSLLRRLLPTAVFDATVLSQNAASRALFLNAGYTFIEDELCRSFPQ